LLYLIYSDFDLSQQLVVVLPDPLGPRIIVTLLLFMRVMRYWVYMSI